VLIFLPNGDAIPPVRDETTRDTLPGDVPTGDVPAGNGTAVAPVDASGAYGVDRPLVGAVGVGPVFEL
tara:strand:- start:341 stop:544 length:204 start_codon:yes stop_codon:yes gene_type:complete